MSVSDLEKSIFVGNIHSCVTEEILFELFLQVFKRTVSLGVFDLRKTDKHRESKYREIRTLFYTSMAGPVEKVHIFRNGHQMPYGVVYYKHAEAVPYAVELLDGIWIYGQPIKLQCKYGRHYQENDIWCTTGMDSGVMANSKGAVYRDDMASNVNNSPGVENHCKTPHGWSDMPLNRSYDMCLSVVPAAVWYSPPLQQWMESGYPPGHPTRMNSPGSLGHLIPMRVVQM